MLTSSKDHSILAGASWKITVHDFVGAATLSTPGTALRLEQGRNLAFTCSSSDQWVTPQLPIESSTFTLHCDRLYQYRFSPPPSPAGIWSVSILEWGRPSHADDPDHLRLQDLQNFESTDFQASLMYSRSGQLGPSHHKKRTQDNSSKADEKAKRPRLESFCILALIPQPHFIPPPAVKFQPIDTVKIPPYRKALPSPIAPYDAVSVDRLLNCTSGRGAWLIPVRGSLPWDGASAAVILEETQVASRSPSPCLPVPAAQPSAVTWIADSLHHFWSFLGSIQQAKHLGPLSLSFHVTPADASSTGDTSSEQVWESNSPSSPQHYSERASGSSGDLATDICSVHLEGVDYIKVYHDVPYSLSLRNVLDAYRYQPVNGEVPGRSGANDRKIRILKGACLVFMNECSRAAFLM